MRAVCIRLGEFLRHRWPGLALAFLKKAAENADSTKKVELLLDMAVIYDEIDNMEAAKNTYIEIIGLCPCEARAYYGLGVLYEIRRDFERAIDYYKKAIDLKPDYEKAYYFLGLIYDSTGLKEKAIENLKKATELNPYDFWAHNNLGAVYEELDQNDLALNMFKQALNIIPGQYKALFNMGVVVGKMGYTEKAAGFYIKSIEAKRDYPYSHLNLAVLYKEKGDYLNAEEIISNGIRYNKKSSFLYYNRACFYVNLNRPESAMRDLAAALKLNRELARYMDSDEELQPLKGSDAYKRLMAEVL